MNNICIHTCNIWKKKNNICFTCVWIHAIIQTCLYNFELMFNMCWKITHDSHMINMNYTYVWSQHMCHITKGREIIIQTMIFERFCCGLHLDLGTWFKVIAHPLPKVSVGKKKILGKGDKMYVLDKWFQT